MATWFLGVQSAPFPQENEHGSTHLKSLHAWSWLQSSLAVQSPVNHKNKVNHKTRDMHWPVKITSDTSDVGVTRMSRRTGAGGPLAVVLADCIFAAWIVDWAGVGQATGARVGTASEATQTTADWSLSNKNPTYADYDFQKGWNILFVSFSWSKL